MNKVEKKIVIYVQKTVDSKPYATIYYQNGTELLAPNNLDFPTLVFANYLAKKTVTNEIHGTIYSYREHQMIDRFDISPLTDNDYCIAGSNTGRKYTVDIIKRLIDAASSPEILTPVYLTDGQNNILMNDELFRRNYNLTPPTKEELDAKYLTIENIISEDHNYLLAKTA